MITTSRRETPRREERISTTIGRREEIISALKLKRVILSLIVLILVIIFSVYYMFVIYRGYYTYSTTDLDRVYYSYVEQGRNSTLVLWYAVEYSGLFSDYYSSSFSLFYAYVNYDKNSSIYSVFWLGDQPILQKLLIGQKSSTYYRVISLADIFYNISAQDSSTKALGERDVFLLSQDLRSYVGVRQAVLYKITLENATLYYYIDVITRIPLEVYITSDNYSARAILINARTS
ncbi:MAG: hypothetical protein ABWJ42_01930 [Sulfolobales archaeon]